MAEAAPKIETSAGLSTMGNIICGALTAGDINTALKCYETGATVVFDTGEQVTGRDDIGKAFLELSEQNPTITYLNAEILESGDLALIRHSWNLKGIDAEGNPVDDNFVGTGVARRQENGEWLIAIDSPYNAD
jgi:ketosteroid isomerase-like protein